MPLYEYECQACGNHIEEQQRLADAPLVTCPKCGKDQLQKVISATAFHLKGGGWYKDLYSSQKPGSSGSSSTPAGTAPKAEGSASSSSESSSTTPAAASTPAASTPSSSGGGSGGSSGT